MTAKLDKLREVITPSTEEEARESMRAYEAGTAPGFVPAENEVLEHHLAEQAFMEERYNVSNDELATRVRSAPDMGGALLVQLTESLDVAGAVRAMTDEEARALVDEARASGLVQTLEDVTNAIERGPRK